MFSNVILGSIGTYLLLTELLKEVNEWFIISFVAANVVSLFYFTYFCFSKNDLINNISEYIVKKDTLQDNDILEIDLNNSIFKGSKNIQNEFQEFNRGNYSRHFSNAFLVKKESTLTNKSLFLYQFHYVDKQTIQVPVTSTNAQGQTTTTMTTQTIYHHYNRYGIIYDLLLAKNIKVLSDKTPNNSVEYNSSSIEFSEQFNVGANSELEAAKFLKPPIIELILKINNLISSPNIEINRNGLMCLSFNDSDLWKAKTTKTLSEPQLFYDELSQHAELNKLESLLSCITQLETKLS